MTRFDPRAGLVVVRAILSGPAGEAIAHLAIDTGATETMISNAALVSLGYDPALSIERRQVTTASTVEFMPRIAVTRLRAIGAEIANFKVLAHTLPTSASVDGVLGLDFLRDRRLIIDFRKGEIDLG